MKTVLQRVRCASVSVGGEIVGSIGPGLMALIGVERGDTERDVATTVRKIAGLRCFAGDSPMDRSVLDVDGAILAISQFTLAANLTKGRRPSFNGAEDPALAEPMYMEVVEGLRAAGIPVETGRFGAHMVVSLENDGPVTLVLHVRDGQVV